MNLENKEPLISSNVISKMFFFYITKVLSIGSKKTYENSDLFKLPQNLQYNVHSDKYLKYHEEKSKKGWSTTKIFVYWMLKYFFPIMLFYFFYIGLTMTLPFLLKYIIEWLANPLVGSAEGYVLFGLIAFVSIVTPFLSQHGMHYTYKLWVKSHIIIFVLYFRKIKKIRMNVSHYIDMGKISTIITADIMRIGFLGFMAHRLIYSPLQLILFTWFIYREVGWVCFVGLAFILVITFIQGKISFLNSKQMMNKFIVADQRNKKVNNSINGIISVKYNAWEKVILNMLRKSRLAEKKIVFILVILRATQDGIIYLMPIFTSLIVIVTYQKVTGNILTIAQMFFIINVYNQTIMPLTLFFFALNSAFEAIISLKRVDQILQYPDEFEKNGLTFDDPSLGVGGMLIKNGEFSYDEKIWKEYNFKINNPPKTPVPDFSIKSVLKNINVEFKPGEFVAIIGKVGSGKSSLLKSFFGVLHKINGEVSKNGKIGYVPQNAFLLNDSLKENILFGIEYDEEKFKETIRHCQLIDDINMLPGKEMTEIGENGINLSGGQKQRISLARAVYADADIYLIDDSLSALDPHVGKKIFENVFCEILKNKTRILVTHALQYLPQVERVIFMEEGEILFEGKYDELINTNEKFKQFVTEEQNKVHEEENDKKKVEENGENLIEEDAKEIKDFDLVDDSIMSYESIGKLDSIRQASINMMQKSVKKLEGKLIKAEKRFKGTINFNIYVKYLGSGGGLYFFINILIFILGVVSSIITDYWVASWASNTYNLTQDEYINYYIMIAFITLILIFIRGLIFGHYSSKICFNIFQNFINKLLHKNMVFFDTTPMGQILNLTSKDTDYMDTRLNVTFYSFLSMALGLIATFIFISINNVIVIPMIVFSLIFFFFIIKLYLKTSLELRRLETLAYSPILSNISEFFTGLATFRSLNKTDYMNVKFEKNVSLLCSIMYHDRMCQVFINLWTQLLLAIITSFFCLLIVLGKDYSWSFVIKNTNVLAVSLNMIFIVPNTISFFMFTLAELIKGMNSIERLIMNLDDENDERSYYEPKAPENWPMLGEIKASHFDIRYRKGLPLVLKDVSFHVAPGEKIGVIGRTGSGKSTVLKALTRILEIDSEIKGFIEIDGIKINEIGLFALRSKISVIPQDPFLFQGTLKENIDPMEKFNDQIIKQALEKSFLWDSTLFEEKMKVTQVEQKNKKKDSKQPKLNEEKDNDKTFKTLENIEPIISDQEKFNFKVESKGLNLSNGQRQLLCIARCLLEKPRILLMDEATSNIDPNTDKKLHDLIKSEFINSTIITIAHRIDTIIDYDKVFVFDQGNLTEIGTPRELMNNKNSQFNLMIRKNGKEFYKRMKKILSNK